MLAGNPGGELNLMEILLPVMIIDRIKLTSVLAS
jgi:hypothetical protein